MNKRSALVQVIQTISTCGLGTPESPFRDVLELWSADGEMIAYYDQIERRTISEMIATLTDKTLDDRQRVEICQSKLHALAGSYTISMPRKKV